LALVTFGILALQKLNEVLFKCHCETGDCLQEPLGEVEAINRIHRLEPTSPTTLTLERRVTSHQPSKVEEFVRFDMPTRPNMPLE
jgi:hypothetical protein